MFIHITGAWTHLLTDWLNHEEIAAPSLRAQLATYQADELLPIAQWFDLLAQASALRPNHQALGLEIGSGITARHTGVLGYLMLTSSYVGDILAIYRRYEKLIYGHDLVDIIKKEHYIELRWPTIFQHESGIIDEVNLAGLTTFLRNQLGLNHVALQLGFIHTASTTKKNAYEHFFGCPIEFKAPCTYIRFPESYLNISLPMGDTYLCQLLTQRAEALIEALPKANHFEQTVQQHLVQILPEGHVSAAKIAKSLNLSTRTLQRRLIENNLTWQILLDLTREKLARQYLRNKSLGLAEIGLLLGYSDQTSFTKAFKRWMGCSPLTYRKSINSEQ